MNINRNNCESFFLDYYEKTLSPVAVAEVLFFLEENPDLKDVFESYEAVFLEQDKVNFPGKDSLKKKYSTEEIDSILSSEISRSNYEQFFIASAEGILSDSHELKLHVFISENPGLKKEFDLFHKLKLSEEKISFEHKELLKKTTVNALNREEYFIRAIEEDLSLPEQSQLSLFLQKNPEYKKEFDLFKNTILVPEKISFGFKSGLKKRERKPVFIALFSQRNTYYAAAAAVLLLAGLFFFFRSDNNNANNLADNTKEVNATPEKENSAPIKKEQVNIPQENISSDNNSPQTGMPQNIFAKKNLTATNHRAKEEKEAISPLFPEVQPKEPLTAKKEEMKAPEEEKIEAPITANNNEIKKDSAASTTALTEAIAASTTTLKKNTDQYQTIASVVNNKIRSLLGIKKATPCESSDKITLWDLAMAAKNKVQNALGTKALDVNKVCDGTGTKVEYVFAAGNFEISKNASR